MCRCSCDQRYLTKKANPPPTILPAPPGQSTDLVIGLENGGRLGGQEKGRTLGVATQLLTCILRSSFPLQTHTPTHTHTLSCIPARGNRRVRRRREREVRGVWSECGLVDGTWNTQSLLTQKTQNIPHQVSLSFHRHPPLSLPTYLCSHPSRQTPPPSIIILFFLFIPS